MISFDFDYYVPSSLYEAVSLYSSLLQQGKQPLYYAGGTEIITYARRNRLYTNAVIDLKGIPECNLLMINDQQLVIGSTLSLTQIAEENYFPLLSKTVIGAADQTTRNKITIGGNICGRIKYKEAILPFLLTDSEVVVAGEHGVWNASIHSLFNEQWKLNRGEFVVQLHTDRSYLQIPFRSIKKRKIGKVGYPLITVAALKANNTIRFAFSGVCEFPFRSREVEEALNEQSIPIKNRVDKALHHLPAPIFDDLQGSASYRRYVLCLTLAEILTELEGGGSIIYENV